MKTLKPIILLLLSAIMLFIFCSCADTGFGDVSRVEVIATESQAYTQAEINSAIKTAKNYFKQTFGGCKLLAIGYAGDDSIEEAKEWVKTYEADKAIILISDFEVDSSGGDGSLEPNSTYTEWEWVLVKNGNGPWKHATHGYG